MIAGLPLWAYGVAIAAGYLLGSIPFGLVLTRIAGLGDIRTIGSGNIGATNVLRTGRKGLAFATLLLDGLKGAVAAWLVLIFVGGEAVMLALTAGFAAVIGHNFPVWLHFKGGKGVATSIGLMVAVAPVAGVMAIATWVAIAFIYRISSLAALVALALAPFYALFLGYPVQTAAFAILGVLGWIRHGANLRRLLKGEEPRIGSKTESAQAT